MKIDTHQHYWHYDPQALPWISAHMPELRQDRMPADCERAMQLCGIDAVVAVQARSQTQETDFLLGLAAQHPRIIGVVGWVDLVNPGVEAQLDQWADQAALSGFRHILQDEADIMALICSPTFNSGVSYLHKHHYTYDVLVFDHQIPVVVDFCKQHDTHWLVLDHVGKPAVRDWLGTSPRWSECIEELAAMPHVMCKLSGLVTETDWQQVSVVPPADIQMLNQRKIFAYFDKALDAFGSQRLMFGSDWPVCQLAAPYALVHDMAQAWARARLSESEQQAFWSGNALRCYDLTVPPGLV